MVVVTNRGPMLTPEEMAAAHPFQPQSPVAPATTAPAPLVPIAPPVAGPAVQPPLDTVPQPQPQPISQPGPVYPQRALDAEKEGVVRLRLFITPDGLVAAAKVLSAQPSGWFERAAEDGVKRWRYAPSEFGGTAEVDVEFKLK
jgi:protein TonB